MFEVARRASSDFSASGRRVEGATVGSLADDGDSGDDDDDDDSGSDE